MSTYCACIESSGAIETREKMLEQKIKVSISKSVYACFAYVCTDTCVCVLCTRECVCVNVCVCVFVCM